MPTLPIRRGDLVSLAVLAVLLLISASVLADEESVPILMDFGDAPDTYGTLLASGGPSHIIGAPPVRGLPPGPTLGTIVDDEPDGQPSLDATGDDLAGLPDEDGVTFDSPIEPGFAAFLTVIASAPCVLDAWYDFDANGTFDPGDQIFMSQSLVPGPNPLLMVVPASAVPGPSFARFRCSTAGGLPPVGPAPDGEVEDHAVTTLPVELQSLSVD